jgi:hypothetical protein
MRMTDRRKQVGWETPLDRVLTELGAIRDEQKRQAVQMRQLDLRLALMEGKISTMGWRSAGLLDELRAMRDQLSHMDARLRSREATEQ